MAAPRVYFVRWQGRVSGPLDRDGVIRGVQQGLITRDHEISEDQARWVRAGEAPELFGRHASAPKESPGGDPLPRVIDPDASPTPGSNEAREPSLLPTGPVGAATQGLTPPPATQASVWDVFGGITKALAAPAWPVLHHPSGEGSRPGAVAAAAAAATLLLAALPPHARDDTGWVWAFAATDAHAQAGAVLTILWSVGSLAAIAGVVFDAYFRAVTWLALCALLGVGAALAALSLLPGGVLVLLAGASAMACAASMGVLAAEAASVGLGGATKKIGGVTVLTAALALACEAWWLASPERRGGWGVWGAGAWAAVTALMLGQAGAGLGGWALWTARAGGRASTPQGWVLLTAGVVLPAVAAVALAVSLTGGASPNESERRFLVLGLTRLLAAQLGLNLLLGAGMLESLRAADEATRPQPTPGIPPT